jgi:N-acetylglucosaminyldiphosphoundecaprenol N-acetyl-beta-D-mannosaminyltransferase
MHKVKILDYLVSDFYSIYEALENYENIENSVVYRSQNDSNIHIITLNMEHLHLAEKMPEFKKILTDAELLIPDGESICLLARILAKQKIKKIAGIDLAEKLINNYSRIAFLGAEKTVSDSLRNLLTARYSSESVSHSSGADAFNLNARKEFFFEHGFYEKNQEESIIERIVNFNPELLLVALGSPAQEFLIAKYRHLFKNTVMVGVGGSFDIFTGKLSRAPRLFIKLKLEWLFRILQEPKRALRFLSNLKNFLALILKSSLHK